jgi:hypothetical protein
MSYHNTLEAAIESLHEIEDLVKSFSKNGDIHPVEIDLTLQKIRNLYELMLMLKKPLEYVMPPQQPVIKNEAKAVRPEKDVAGQPEPVNINSNADVREHKKLKNIEILSERFKAKETLHESLHHSVAKDENTLAQARPVSNLASAIGINDRFTFIRELFNNDVKLYENTVTLLNDAANFNDAYNYMIQHFDWDMDSESVQLLLEIIRRKYITGRHE